jgi:hypothetical protein
MTNTPAYYSTELITSIKSFIVQAPGVRGRKPFKIIVEKC